MGSKELHDRYVEKTVRDPEILGINSERVIYRQSSPKLKDKNKETGDILIVWRRKPELIEILIAEVTTDSSIFKRKIDKRRLKLSKDFFLKKREEALDSICEVMSKDIRKMAEKITFRGAAICFDKATSFFHEGPSRITYYPEAGGYLIYEQKSA